MMILDRLDHASMYRPLGPVIAAALDYLCRADFSRVPDGRHELDGERLFAIVQQYQTKPLAEAIWEAHRQYVDVQYLIRGAERIGYAKLRDDLPILQPYDSAKDVVLFRAAGDLFTLQAGDFAIFARQDVHAPCLALGQGDALAEVRKAVVKCRVT